MIEVQHVNAIPANERHGKPRDLFPVWFSLNLSIGGAIFGALAVAVGNNLFWSIIVILLGNALGGVFMALHSAQGAKLGVPQLIQSRSQFGFFGALLPVILAAFLYLGFFATTAVVGGQAVHAAMPGLSLDTGTVIVAVISLVIALIGYRAIHSVMKWAMWPLAIMVLIVTVGVLIHGGYDFSPIGFAVGPFLSGIGLIATFLLTYGPYVSDYSRYLPANTKPSSAFGWTFSGAFIGTSWPMLVGVFLGVQFDPNDIMASVNDLFGGTWIVAIILIFTALATGANNTMNLYGNMLNMITAGTSVKPIKPSRGVRIAMLMPTFIIGLYIALFAYGDDFAGTLGIFLSFLMLGFVPWGAINLLDFYAVRKGQYRVEDFFKPRGVYFHNPSSWTFAGINWKAFIAYFAGIAVSLPFMNNGLIVGPMTDYLGGADISWIPGLIVSGGLYLILTAGNQRETLDQEATPEPLHTDA